MVNYAIYTKHLRLDKLKNKLYFLSMENLTISEKIKIIAGRSGLSVSALARVLGESPQNFAQKLKRDNFRVDDLQKIATACGYDLHVDFVKKADGGPG